MASPLATVYSLIDQVKRNLSPRGMKSTVDQTAFDLQQLQKKMETAQSGGPEAAAAQSAVTEKMLNAVLNFAPGGIGAQILLHGGPSAIAKVNPERLGAVGTVYGPGFYTSNKTATPLTYARNARDVGAGPGVISAFDLPDELYAKTLQLTDKPLAKQPNVVTEISSALNSDKQLFDMVMSKLQEEVKFGRSQGLNTDATKTLTGEWLDSILNTELGKSQASALLAKHGIPGKTWSAAEKEAHTVIYPEYLNQLESVGSVPLMPMQKLTDNALKYMIKNYEATK